MDDLAASFGRLKVPRPVWRASGGLKVARDGSKTYDPPENGENLDFGTTFDDFGMYEVTSSKSPLARSFCDTAFVT